MITEMQTLLASHILYEDNHLLAVNKQPSQIVQGDKTGDIPLSEMGKAYLKEKYSKPGAVFLGVIHRLDRPVSGVVLFARTDKALSRMNEQFREREIEKTYWAVVRGIPEKEEATLVHHLKKDEQNNRSRAVKEGIPGALRCELQYRTVEKGERYTLLEVRPLTGRHHQIRVQLASIGCPIVGDVKYGDRRANDDKSICLHARELKFNHPVQKQPVSVVAAPPATKYWQIFGSGK